jgi:hypothetical protein
MGKNPTITAASDQLLIGHATPNMLKTPVHTAITNLFSTISCVEKQTSHEVRQQVN